MTGIAGFIPRLAVLLVLNAALPALAQETDEAPRETRESRNVENEIRVAPVVVDGESLFSVRGVTAHPAELRASQISDRIQAIAENPDIAGTSLTLQEHPGATWIMSGRQRIMAVTDDDGAVEDIARGPLAEVYRLRIAKAIEEYRQFRRAGSLWLDALYAVGATVVLFFVAWAALRIVPRLRTTIERRYRTRIEGLAGRTHQIVKVEQVWFLLTGLLNVGWVVGIIVVLYAYLNYVLALFPWTRGFARRLLSIVLDPLQTIGSGLVSIIPNLVFLAIFALVIRYALKLIHLFFDGVEAGRITMKGFEPEWALPTYRLVRIIVIAFAAVVAYPHIPGSQSGAFKGISLFAGVLFSLGSSSLIGNVIAGFSMTYRRAFKIGDRVKIGEQMGDVELVRLLVTHLRTVKNEEIIVPNSNILASEIINFSSLARERGLILHTTVDIRYDVPWRQVDAMLLEAAARTSGVLRQPPPYVLKKEFKETAVTYEINVYCDAPQKMGLIYTELHGNILDVFNEYGVQIMVPGFEGDPDQPKIVPKDQWYAAPARPLRAEVVTNSDPITQSLSKPSSS
jgi:small-conductance mechanosensitive channel